MPKLDPCVSVRRCADDLGHSPSRTDYVRWRRRLDQPRSVPSDQRIALGATWLGVLAGVGLEPRSRRFADVELWRVVTQARSVLGAPSMGEYDRWRQHTSPKPPSHTTLMARTGRRWVELFPAVRG